jgi:hypothetical protein
MLLVFLMTAGYLSKNYSEAMKNVDLFDEVIAASDSKIVEYGVRAVLKIEEDQEEYCVRVLRELNIESKSTNMIKSDKIYCLEFNNSDLNGYIESMSYDNYNVVTLNILKKDTENGISDLRNLIEDVIGESGVDIRYFQYLKAQVMGESDLNEINSNIEKLLKLHNASSIDTVRIENGYSTVAYTKRYPVMRSNGKYMDFNYAVCSYTSGNYIIIGTPTIITTY